MCDVKNVCITVINQWCMCVLYSCPLAGKTVPCTETVHILLKLLDFFIFYLFIYFFFFQHAPPGVERLLIGNKCDLEASREVESESGKQLARSQGIPFLETSAKTNHNINEVRGHL